MQTISLTFNPVTTLPAMKDEGWRLESDWLLVKTKFKEDGYFIAMCYRMCDWEGGFEEEVRWTQKGSDGYGLEKVTEWSYLPEVA